MGRDTRELDIKVCWTVSRHNSRDDKIDDLLEEQLREELDGQVKNIEAIIDKPDYKRLNVFIT